MDLEIKTPEFCNENCKFFDPDHFGYYSNGTLIEKEWFCVNQDICKNALKMYKDYRDQHRGTKEDER